MHLARTHKRNITTTRTVQKNFKMRAAFLANYTTSTNQIYELDFTHHFISVAKVEKRKKMFQFCTVFTFWAIHKTAPYQSCKHPWQIRNNFTNDKTSGSNFHLPHKTDRYNLNTKTSLSIIHNYRTISLL